MLKIKKFSKLYPELLKQINDPPDQLFVNGNPEILNNPCVSVVGTRKCTAYGKSSAEYIGNTLAQNNIIIVSGLAIGIDAAAHFCALKNRAKTIAVMAGGADMAFPPAHQNLANSIIAHGGALISEYPPGTPAFKSNFVARNRIIAGLSKLTVVCEAGYSSGALITARFALEYCRDVAAIPFPLFCESGKGCNELIRSGAHCITDSKQMLELLGIDTDTERSSNKGVELKKYISAQPELEFTDDKIKILNTLKGGARSIDQIADETKINASECARILTMLELDNLIGGENGFYFYGGKFVQ